MRIPTTAARLSSRVLAERFAVVETLELSSRTRTLYHARPL